MISSVAPTRLSTFYVYLITKIENRNLKDNGGKVLRFHKWLWVHYEISGKKSMEQ